MRNERVLLTSRAAEQPSSRAVEQSRRQASKWRIPDEIGSDSLVVRKGGKYSASERVDALLDQEQLSQESSDCTRNINPESKGKVCSGARGRVSAESTILKDLASEE